MVMAMDIGNISSMVSNSLNNTGQAEKLKNQLESGNYANSTDEELMDACKQFEAYWVEMVFKEMEKTAYVFSDEKSDPNNTMVDYFKETTIQELSSNVTENQGLGLAQMLFEQMKRNYSI